MVVYLSDASEKLLRSLFSFPGLLISIQLFKKQHNTRAQKQILGCRTPAEVAYLSELSVERLSTFAFLAFF